MYKEVNELLGTDFKNNSEINWRRLCIDHKLSEEFIETFDNYVDWTTVIRYQNLSEDFIRKYLDDKMFWPFTSQFQSLSENFIREFKDEVDWWNISENQILSWDFILEFEDKVNWNWISRHQPFIDDSTYKRINEDMLEYNELYHLYQQTENKGWFWGYNITQTPSGRIFFDTTVDIDHCYFNKARIYWKDLIQTFLIRDYELIRQFKFI